jgi:AcrR family transcriptional regulator
MIPDPSAAAPPPRRASYRHGDLRRALLDAGVALARAGGPDAVVLREATRRAGVVPNAAYRHFAGRDDLLRAVRAAALSALAVAMEAELARVDRDAAPAAIARAELRAVGTGYLRFARAETGLFRTAFALREAMPLDADPERVGRSGFSPFGLLGAALDRLVAAGVLAAARRPDAEYLCWSTVHGMALLIVDGVLQGRAEAAIDALGRCLLDMVERGL